MIRYEEALKILWEAADEAGRLPYSSVPLKDAVGRVCASSLHADEALPPFDNSSMDGFALRAQDANGKPLPILGRLAAGDAPISAAPGGVYEITTGAPVPAGCDAVVKVEDCKVSADGKSVQILEKPETGDYIRLRGADFKPGSAALDSGALIEARHILALAALGVDRVPVRWKPKVAVISTGRELVEAGERPGPGQIRNATGVYLAAALAEMGCEPRDFGVCRDDAADFTRRLDRVLEEETDLILTTGAVSMGRHDFVPKALEAHGAEILFHKTAIRPGKPVLAARFGNGKVLLGLPGNPLSTVVGLRFFAAPLLRRLMGRPDEAPRRLKLSAPVEKPEGLRCFFKAAYAGPDVEILKGQASFQIEPLLASACWAVLPEEGARVDAGTEVEVYPL